ncbi:DUF1640 domain-containing protein [Arsenophonus sp. PmNCSU2021_1]|uniref:DUF1640 domain-containing protein n=1 Tax=Arsenophonus sp. PmNCSU2021_1 TaxID=3118989 RepID=UPI002FF18DF8
MGQVAFDTLQASEELQTAGLTSQQAKAISLVVRKSHEVADIATKADIADVKRDISDVRKEITDVRKDLSAEIADVRKDIDVRFDKVDAQIADVRKDMENRFDKLGLQLTVRLGGMLILAIGALTAILKLVH